MDRREEYYHDRVRAAQHEYEGFDLPTTEFVLNLFYTYDVMHQYCARYLAEYGLSKSSLNILMVLKYGPPEGMQLHDLGELLLVSRANITGLIDHLETKGLVNRVVDSQDRRARFARITPQALTLLNEFMPVHYRNINGMLEGLSAEEKDTLVALLKKARASAARAMDNTQMAPSSEAIPSTVR